jgi:hypothetical protein
LVVLTKSWRRNNENFLRLAVTPKASVEAREEVAAALGLASRPAEA